MVYPVLEFREEKQTFAKVKRGNVDFSLLATMVAIKNSKADEEYSQRCCIYLQDDNFIDLFL